ncbi:glycosyltransferase family A protein [Saccharolobus islandicus]|uniref:glycosyltransferase family A protein n=1 Tax=Saccharolobus islandicus TaxID=43080 RepID=UPI00064FC188|nr:glycosyltransferase family A protein [Sulfolobus islandicus]
MVDLTILIIARNRKSFLLDAVSSCLNQTVSKKRYEIIVVKNFTDEYIDRKLEELGIINVNTVFHSLGEK